MRWFYRLLFALLEMTTLITKLSLTQYSWLEIKCGYKAENGTPLVCYKCGCSDFKYGKSYSEEGIGLIEYEYKCKSCDNLVGYWAYGNWTI